MYTTVTSFPNKWYLPDSILAECTVLHVMGNLIFKDVPINKWTVSNDH